MAQSQLSLPASPSSLTNVSFDPVACYRRALARRRAEGTWRGSWVGIGSVVPAVLAINSRS